MWTGSRDRPVAVFDAIEAIREIPKQHGIRATLANNEALSVAMVNGSQMMGLRSVAVMKSVGVHVATGCPWRWATWLALIRRGRCHCHGR